MYLQTKLRFGVVLCGLLIAISTQPDEQFVIAKEKKSSVSTSQMKEDICEDMFSILEDITDTVQLLTQTEAPLLKTSRQMINDNLKSCKKELPAVHTQARTLATRANAIRNEARQLVQISQALVAKINAK